MRYTNKYGIIIVMIEVEWIIQKVEAKEYYFSNHGDKERQNDDLSIVDVEEAIINGRILEQYEDTGRGESCLVVGFSAKGKPIHVMCGKRKETLAVITVYIPTPPKFVTPYQRG